MGYKLVMGFDHNQLSERVSELMADGYITKGYPFIDKDDCFYQAVEMGIDDYSQQDMSFALKNISGSLTDIVSILDSRLH